jgi:hypothetical protein
LDCRRPALSILLISFRSRKARTVRAFGRQYTSHAKRHADGFNRVLEFDEGLTHVFRVSAIVFFRKNFRDVAALRNLSISCNPPPPSTLGAAGAKLWGAIQGEYQIGDAGGTEMLLQICSAADRADEFAATIASDGPVIRTKTGMHPLLKHELATRAFIVRALHRLGLDIEPTRNVVGRPPGTFNRGG